MKTIWSRTTGGVDLVTHEFGDTDHTLALRIPREGGPISVRELPREDALTLAAAIQAHYAATPTQGMHSCRLERLVDAAAVEGVEQYLVRCLCHQAGYSTWRPEDGPYHCPATGFTAATVGGHRDE